MVAGRYRVWRQPDGRWCIAADYGRRSRGRPFFIGGSPAQVMDCQQMWAHRDKIRRRRTEVPNLSDEVERLIQAKGVTDRNMR